jgi:UDP-N-acetylglucosamine 2-epimerase
MIKGLEDVLLFEKPDLVIVVGDTNSTLAGAISTAKLGLPLAHVEAGVRAKDHKLPEQINRVITDSVADYFLCPTPSSVDNLKQEGKSEHIFDTGDVIYDCLRLYERHIPDASASISNLPDKFALATIHRAEAVDNKENLQNILCSLGTTPMQVVFPVHPRTRKRMQTFGLADKIPTNLIITNPVGYLEILSLIKRSNMVITDSGGIQRESIFLGKPVILARPETEWLELEKSGWLKVFGYTFDLSHKIQFPKEKSREIEHLMRPASANIARILSGL